MSVEEAESRLGPESHGVQVLTPDDARPSREDLEDEDLSV